MIRDQPDWLCDTCGHIGHRAKYCWLLAPTPPPLHQPPSFPKQCRPPPPAEAGKVHKGSLTCRKWEPWDMRIILKKYDERFWKAMRAWDNWTVVVLGLLESRLWGI